MQEIKWHRNVVIGIVVGAIFFGWWLRGFLYSNWHFQLFSRRSWSYVANEFESGWMLNAKSDWIFLITLLLAIPLFLYLWYLCTKVRWRKLIKKIWKWIVALCLLIFAGKAVEKRVTKKKKKTTLAPPPPAALIKTSSTSARPRPIGHSTPMINVTAPDVAYTTAPTFSGTAATSDTTALKYSATEPAWQKDTPPDDISNIPLDDIQLPQREPVVENIPELFTNAGYQLIEGIKTSLQTLDFLAVAADRIYAVLIDKEPGDWLAEEEPFNGEAPLWFSEVDHRVSPIYELKQSVTELQGKIDASFPDKKIQAFMIEQKGNIINAEEMLRIWKELNVIVSRTDIGGTEDLPVTTLAVEATNPASAAEVEKITKLVKGES